MRLNLHALLSFSFFLFIVNPIFAADFNIKLRKTDINELKQQLMPRFEQNIAYLNELVNCLDVGKTLNTCLNEYALVVEKQDSSENLKRNDEIRRSIESKVDEDNIQPEALLSELKKLLMEAESIKSCLNKGRTANDLKDCIVKH